MFSRRAIVVILCLVASHTSAKSQTSEAKAEWRLDNPFRLFKRADDTALHRRTYLDLSDEERLRPILAIEQRLAKATGGLGWARSFHDGRGLMDSLNAEACWYSAAACGDYVHPMNHKVKVWAPGISEPCVWRWNGGEAFAPDCSGETAISIPYPAGARVSAIVNSRTVAVANIKVRDLFILSMGDSFSSGEGNPDKAVSFDKSKVLNYDTRDTDLRGFPTRDGLRFNTGSASPLFVSDKQFQQRRARWVHQSCHRSLYSSHLRAALQIAIEDEKQQTSITFVSLACTGSEIIQGFFSPWNGNTELAPNAQVTISQLSGAANAMCRGATQSRAFDFSQDGALPALSAITLRHCPERQARPIDLVMLSAGGNDVGFTSLIANATIKLDAALEGLAPLFGAEVKINSERAIQKAQALQARYAALADAIRRHLYVSQSARVLLTAYPHLAYDENGEPCSETKAGMDVSEHYLVQPRKAVEAESFVQNTLTPIMNWAAKSNGWTFVERHRSENWFRTHGVCAASEADRRHAALGVIAFPKRPTPPDSSDVNYAEGYRSTERPKGQGHGLNETARVGTKWAPFEPQLFRPYASRQRWFRTPNDAYLTAHYHDDQLLGDMIAVTRFSAYSGAFHLTAEGHAAIADAVHEKAREVLGR